MSSETENGAKTWQVSVVFRAVSTDDKAYREREISVEVEALDTNDAEAQFLASYVKGDRFRIPQGQKLVVLERSQILRYEIAPKPAGRSGGPSFPPLPTGFNRRPRLL